MNKISTLLATTAFIGLAFVHIQNGEASYTSPEARALDIQKKELESKLRERENMVERAKSQIKKLEEKRKGLMLDDSNEGIEKLPWNEYAEANSRDLFRIAMQYIQAGGVPEIEVGSDKNLVKEAIDLVFNKIFGTDDDSESESALLTPPE